MEKGRSFLRHFSRSLNSKIKYFSKFSRADKRAGTNNESIFSAKSKYQSLQSFPKFY